MVSFWDRNGEKKKQISLRQYVFSWVNSISLFYYVNQYSVRVMYVFKHYFFHSLSFQSFCYSKYVIESNYCRIENLKSLLTIPSSINPLIILHTQTESHAHTNCHMHKMTFTLYLFQAKFYFKVNKLNVLQNKLYTIALYNLSNIFSYFLQAEVSLFNSSLGLSNVVWKMHKTSLKV